MRDRASWLVMTTEEQQLYNTVFASVFAENEFHRVFEKPIDYRSNGEPIYKHSAGASVSFVYERSVESRVAHAQATATDAVERARRSASRNESATMSPWDQLITRLSARGNAPEEIAAMLGCPTGDVAERLRYLGCLQ